MSKLGCACGHVISDQTDNLPYKALILRDAHQFEFFDWIATETQSYLEATRDGRAKAWLLERGFKQDYVDLNLSHGEVLHDHIHGRLLTLKRDMYECESCGRVHIEARENNRFISFRPDNGQANAILSGG